jgi:hypothetical protein
MRVRYVWVSLLTTSAMAQAPSKIHLQVLTTAIDFNTHNLKIELQKQSSKIVAAASLRADVAALIG